MVESQKRKLIWPITLALCVILFFLPFIINPGLLANKDNDLGRTYIPIYSYINKKVYQDKSLPLWRGEQLLGESLIASPLSSLLYPPNVIFLIFSPSFAAIIYYILHFEIAVLSTFLLAKSFKLSSLSALGAAIFYTFSEKFILHIAAGHITMIAAFSHFPLGFYLLRKIIENRSLNKALYFALCLSAILITYPTIFYYSSIFYLIYIIYKLTEIKKTIIPKISLLFAGSFVLSFCLSAIFLIPQLEFSKFSNRTTLTMEDVAIPVWNFKLFLSSLFFPHLSLKNFDHESLLYIGAVPLLLAAFYFWKLSIKLKLLMVTLFSLTVFVVLGTSTPFFKIFFENFPFVSYSRVTTRLWFAPILTVSILAAFTLERIKYSLAKYLLIGIFIVESLAIGYPKLFTGQNLSFTNRNLYEYLKKDKEKFRVWCTTYCFNPQMLSESNIEILNGETPIASKSTIDFLEKAGNYEFNRFAVIYPPYQVWQTNNPPVPNTLLLGRANVKYIASTYPLNQLSSKFLGKFENIYLYENLNFRSRYLFTDGPNEEIIVKKSANSVYLEFNPESFKRELFISESYLPGWQTYQNNRVYTIDRYDDTFQKTTVLENTNRIELKYKPQSYIFGKAVTIITIISIFILLFRKPKNSKI